MGNSVKERIREGGFSAKARRISWLALFLIRVLGSTLRWRLEDPQGISNSPPQRPMIWTVWHNRIFSGVPVHRKYLKTRNGAILSSASSDGEIIGAFAVRAGFGSVRGSSSKRGASALLALTDWLERGDDVFVVPDGPRGPRYRLAPGAIKLAEVTGAAILPIRIQYRSCWKFKSWDRFQLPKPFTTVTVSFGPLLEVPQGLSEEGFEAKRQEVEKVMNPDDETD
ncbi:MAG: lysophospholipid acyltransferase family protein [Verrucomicrobiota bacterium]